MKFLFTGTLALLLLAGAALAEQPIRGFVIDGTSEEPLPAANVVVVGTSRGSTTNLDGYFLIPGMAPGRYTLEIRYLGYHGKEMEISVSGETMEPLRIELLPSSVQLEAVTYTVKEEDDKAKRESPRVSTVPVDGSTLRQIPSFGAEVDVLRAIQAIPGVKASSDLSSAPYVRGASPDMTLILMDQSVVYNPSHLFGLFSTFNADAVKRLELIKGGFPAEYGGRAGSVLEVITNEGNRRKHEGLVSASIVAARAALEGPLPEIKGSYAISGRRTYFEPILEALRNSDESMEDLPDYNFYDANGKVNFDITPKTTVTIGGYIGQDEFGGEFGSDDARAYFDSYWGNKTVTGRLRHVLSDYTFLTFGSAFSRYRSGAEFWDKDEAGEEDILIQNFRNRFNDFNARLDLEYFGFSNHRIKGGLQFNSYNVNILNNNDDLTWIDLDTTTAHGAAYIQDRWEISPLFEVFPGVRAYYNEDGGLFRVDPRMAMVYHHSPTMRFKLAGGRYHQWVNIAKPAGDMLSFFDMWFPVDGSVDPTYVDQAVLGWEWDFAPSYEFTFETYYNDMNQLLDFNDRVDEGNSISEAFIEGEGYSYGLEWMLRKKVGRWTGWFGYSLSWSKRRYPDTHINNGDWYYPQWDRRHDFIAMANYQLSKSWELAGQWRYNTGQGYTRGVGVYTYRMDNVDDTYFVGDGRTVLWGEKNNYRFPADHRLDLTATYNHKVFGLPAKLVLSVYNVYNRRAIWFHSEDPTANPAESSDVKLLPVLPLIGYEVRF